MSSDTNERGGGTFAALARLIDKLVVGFAAFGGAILLVVASYVVISISGRSLGTGSLFGDFEVVKYGSGLAAFFFLPLCQWRQEHINVALFSAWLPAQGQGALDRLWQMVFAVVWVVLAWRMMIGGFDAFEWDEKSMIIQFPIWAIYVPTTLCLVLVICAAVLRVLGPRDASPT